MPASRTNRALRHASSLVDRIFLCLRAAKVKKRSGTRAPKRILCFIRAGCGFAVGAPASLAAASRKPLEINTIISASASTTRTVVAPSRGRRRSSSAGKAVALTKNAPRSAGHQRISSPGAGQHDPLQGYAHSRAGSVTIQEKPAFGRGRSPPVMKTKSRPRTGEGYISTMRPCGYDAQEYDQGARWRPKTPPHGNDCRAAAKGAGQSNFGGATEAGGRGPPSKWLGGQMHARRFTKTRCSPLRTETTRPAHVIRPLLPDEKNGKEGKQRAQDH